MTQAQPGAADLLRSIGLLADGPVRWGDRVPGRSPGIYVVELGAPLGAAPLELAPIGQWLERVPGLRLDGERPTSKALAARLASLWWPESTVLYAGAAARATGPRVAALLAHVPGDRQPHPDGQWLQLLRDPGRLGMRLWWAETDAPEEYLDAFLDAFGKAVGEGSQWPEARPAGALALPWANTRRPTGERQLHGLTGMIVPAPTITPEPPRRVVQLPPGDADGAAAEPRGTGTTRRGPAAPTPRRSGMPAAAAPAPPGRGAKRGPASRAGAAEPVQVSQDALDRMRAEVDELTRVQRREVVARIKAAREHGDLKENAEYHAAREEQSFLEGRVLALEDRIRRAVVVEDVVTGRVTVGSRITVEVNGDEIHYTIVGTTEANPAAGRLSMASPVGAALLGAVAGAEVEVRTPRGPVRYRVVSVG